MTTAFARYRCVAPALRRQGQLKLSSAKTKARGDVGAHVDLDPAHALRGQLVVLASYRVQRRILSLGASVQCIALAARDDDHRC